MLDTAVGKAPCASTMDSWKGELPPRVRALVLEWWDLHREELAENWRLVERAEGPEADCAVGVDMVDVTEARYVSEYIVWLRFEDGTEGEIDLSAELYGPIFEPLRDPSYFAQFRVNAETGTVEWPNGADLAPEYLYSRVQVAAN